MNYGSSRNRVGWLSGNFSDDTLRFNKEKSFDLLSYRYAYDDSQKTSTEFTMGNFWGGDRGYLLAENFWHGDTAITVFLKRSRPHAIGSFTFPLISFAGIQLSISLTSRRASGLSHLAPRGNNQWTYTLTQIFNRDRNSTQYYEEKLGRIKNAFVFLSRE